MIKSTPPPTRGFTLIEVLVAVTIAVLVVGFVAAILPRATSASAEQAQTVRATTRVSAVTQILVEQFNDGGFAGFTTGTSSTLTAVFTTGASITVPLQRDFATASTIYVPGLRATVGSQILLVTSSGISKVATVTAMPSTGVFTLDCQPGLPTTGTVVAYPARTLTLALQDGTIRRTTNGVTSSLGSSEGVSFSYLYEETPSGRLIRDPAGAPANRVAAGTLVGLVPVSVDPRADRAAAVPLQVSRIRRMLGCTESAAITPNEGRLNVTISGLPTGATPDVSLSGPDAAVNGQRPTSSQSYQPVQRGTYAMTARQVSAGGRTYVPEVRGSPATLLNTWGQIYMATTYREARGTITANVTGLPAGGQGTITLTGPDAQTISVSNGSTAVGVAAGTYSVSAPAVTISGVTYTPTVPSSITVTNNGNVTLPVNYTAPTGGKLVINVFGLPTGGMADITYYHLATGATSKQTSGSGTVTFSGLAAGNYVVSGSNWLTYAATDVIANIPTGGTQYVTLNYGVEASEPRDPPSTPPPPVLPGDPPSPPATPTPTPTPSPSPTPTPTPTPAPPPSGGGGGGSPQCFYDGHGDGSCGF